MSESTVFFPDEVRRRGVEWTISVGGVVHAVDRYEITYCDIDVYGMIREYREQPVTCLGCLSAPQTVDARLPQKAMSVTRWQDAAKARDLLLKTFPEIRAYVDKMKELKFLCQCPASSDISPWDSRLPWSYLSSVSLVPIDYPVLLEPLMMPEIPRVPLRSY